MSIDLKIKDINNKLIEKHQDGPWSELLIPYFNSTENNRLIHELLNEVQQKIMFKPSLKDWYIEFEKQHWSNVKVVFITHKYIDGGPINESVYFRKFFSSEFNAHASEQGVMFHTIERSYNNQNNHQHEELWHEFNMRFIEFMDKHTNCMMIYIGPGLEGYYGRKTTKQLKTILPGLKHSFWTKDNVEKYIKETVNNSCLSFGMQELKW